MSHYLRRLRDAALGSTGIPNSLTGTFDISGDTLTGYVEKIPYATNEGVVIEAHRLGEIIASTPTARDPGGDRLPFTLPMQNRFHPADLAHESVTIHASSRRGDTGTLKLEGATQLELVRAHLGVPAETILDLDYTRHGNAAPCLGAGWSQPEEKFTWTEDTDSLIHFPSPPAHGRYLLRLRFGSFHEPLVPSQIMHIFVNEQLAADLVTNETGPEFRELRLDASFFALAATTTLRIHHPNAACPRDHHDGNTDARRLAFNFRRLTLVRLLEADS